MKNTNKQNPLKTFNDNYAAKAKKVVEGNKKLVKAQAGIVAKNDSVKYAKNKERYDNYLKEGKGVSDNTDAYNRGRDTTNMKFVKFPAPTGYSRLTTGIPVGPSSNDYYRKKGGQTKTKKK